MAKKKTDNSKGVASLVFGIVSIVFCWVPVAGLASGIIGIILAAKQKRESSNGVATGGLVTSIIGTIFSSIYTIVWLVIVVILGVAMSAIL